MKKIMILTILSLSIVMVGCKNNTTNTTQEPTKNNSTQESTKTNAENTEKTTSTESKVETANVTQETKKEVEVQSRKQEFKVKLDKIQKDLEASEERKKSDEGTTLAMRVYANKQYTEWDKALNEIYGVLKQQLPPDDMKKLENEEIKWIKEKEARVERAGNEFKGGTLEPISRATAAAEATKERCYELVDKYMK